MKLEVLWPIAFITPVSISAFLDSCCERKHEGRRKRQKDEEKENFEEVQQFVNRRKKYRA